MPIVCCLRPWWVCCKVLLVVVLVDPKVLSQSSMEVEDNFTIPIVTGHRELCVNWTEAKEATHHECTTEAHQSTTIKCYGGMTNINLSLPPMEDIEELILCGWPSINFDAPSVLKHFPRLHVLHIEHSDNLTYIEKDFPELQYLWMINISFTKLGYTRPTLFINLHNLKTVDLRWNELDHMEGPLIVAPSFDSLYLTGNPWNCTRNLKWLVDDSKGEQVADRYDMYCADVKYKDRPLMAVMQFKINLREACTNNTDLRNCTCSLSFVRLLSDGISHKPVFSINCSRLHLDHLPEFVPENTTSFYATHNQITDLQPLLTTYRDVQDVYLDYNHITSIDILEGDWLNNFRVFSLKGNKLTVLPVYAMHNALERNHNEVKLYLSQNPWRCDCKFTQRFQELLMRFHMVIQDADNVTCKYIEGDTNFGAQVTRLKRGDFCKLNNEYSIQPLDLLNGVLSTLIVLVLANLAYDYYHYRKSGRLPWIVTKLP